jgi:hypothetical protein
LGSTPTSYNITFSYPASEGVLMPSSIPSGASAQNSNGVLTLLANNLADANTMLNCLVYTPTVNNGNSFNINVTVNNNPAGNIPVTGIPINVPPVVNNAVFAVKQGQPFIITTQMLNITDVDTPDVNLTLSMTNINGGFIRYKNKTASISSYTYQDVVDRIVEGVPDGTTTPFTFNSVIIDRNAVGTNIVPVTNTFTFTPDTLPQLVLNQPISVNQAGRSLITNQTLLATIPNGATGTNFNVFDIQNAQIEKYDNITATWNVVTTFTQDDVNNEWVEIAADDSGKTPVVALTLSDYLNQASQPFSLPINFDAKPVTQLATLNVGSDSVAINSNILLTTSSTASAAQLKYMVPTNNPSGYFANSANKKAPISTFTQAQVNTGNTIVFVTKGHPSGKLQLPISVTDGTLTTSTEMVFDFNIPTMSALARAEQTLKNPLLTFAWGGGITVAGAVGRSAWLQYQRETIDKFAARVCQATNLNIHDFDKNEGGQFKSFITDELLPKVDQFISNPDDKINFTSP